MELWSYTGRPHASAPASFEQVVKVVIGFPAVGEDTFTAEQRWLYARNLVQILPQRGDKAGPDNAHQLKLLFFHDVCPCMPMHAEPWQRTMPR